MVELDELLSIVENPTRRRILESIVKEPSYPLQLSKELGISQQAIMKNLSLMEGMGMVSSYREASNIGPMRTLYVPNAEFTLMIDMHNNMFCAKIISSGVPENKQADLKDVEEAASILKELDEKINELDERRNELLSERDAVMSWFNKMIQEQDDPDEKRRICEILKETR